MSPLITWNYPTRVVFGTGSLDMLTEACLERGYTRPLWVMDAFLCEQTSIHKAQATAQHAGIATTVFSDFSGNPTGEAVERGITAFNQNQCNAVIAIGGGSALDTAKAIALCAQQSRPLWDFEDVGDNFKRADVSRIAPTIAIPTTAGTGSEVGRASVITDTQAKCKKIIFHPDMMPKLVIADPALTTTLPAHLTAATGMDALSHNMEAFFAPGFHPMADGIALEGMRLVKESLELATLEGNNLKARGDMLAASMMGATAFQKGLGAMHALAHPLGALYNAHHGLLNAILMPYVLVLNRSVISNRCKQLARHLSLNEINFEGVLNWVLTLRQRLNIPHCLKDINISSNDIDKIVSMTLADAAGTTNPLPLTESNVRTLFQSALIGDIKLMQGALEKPVSTV